MTNRYIGLMSGTSMDGIDAVLVSFENNSVQLHATHTRHYPDELRAGLQRAIRLPLDVEPDPDRTLDRQVGEQFLQAALAVIAAGNGESILAIGSHGQTLRHQPDTQEPFSLQIGDPRIIAAGSGIATIANFRSADIAAGGQGAPLVPPFHEWVFASNVEARVVINIGGIANITILPHENRPTTGFDTGPGNGLMDAWIDKQRGLPFDDSGKWAAGGKVIGPLLKRMLDDPYVKAAPPKSTGFEYFNLDWLRRFDVEQYPAQDVQSTLCEVTAKTIAENIQDGGAIFVCGGGTHNDELMRRLSQCLPRTTVQTTATAGLDPDWVEATAFAWLGMKTMNNEPGNMPSVTGASHKVVLGDIHLP